MIDNVLLLVRAHVEDCGSDVSGKKLSAATPSDQLFRELMFQDSRHEDDVVTVASAGG